MKSVPLHPKKTTYERNIHYPAAHWQQHIHDFGLVRTPETAADARKRQLATHRSNHLLLGHRILRILPSGACQQDWFHRQRRSLLACSAEGNPGSYLSDGLYGYSRHDVSGRTAALEPFRSLPLPHRSRLAGILEIGLISPMSPISPKGLMSLMSPISHIILITL